MKTRCSREIITKVFRNTLPSGMVLSVEKNVRKIMASRRDASFRCIPTGCGNWGEGRFSTERCIPHGMRYRRIVQMGSLCLLFFTVSACRAEEAEETAAKKPFGPQPHYVDIAKKVAGMLPSKHLLQTSINEKLSCQAWTNLMNAFDPDRSYFLQSDIDDFAQMETKMASAIKAGDVTFGFEVHQAFVRQLENRYTFTTNLLAQTFTFTEDESYAWKRKDLPWPATVEERDEIWRKRIKNELLASIISREMSAAAKTNAAEKLAPPPVEGEPPREPAGGENTQALAPVNGVTTNAASALDPPDIMIGKRYKQFLTIMQDMDEEEVLQRYLNAFAMAYDPHTEYMSPMRKDGFDTGMNLSLIGIGALLRSEDGMAKIMELIPGGPAERDTRDIRLCVGDRIIGVGQGDEAIENVLHWSISKVVQKIRGKKGTKVVLETIPAADPSGTTTKRVDLIRDEVKLEDQAATGRVTRVTLADGSTLKVGIVRLPTFYASMDKPRGDVGYRSATEDVARILADFNNEGVAGLILDLRNNGGGALKEATALTGLFVRSGPAVQVRELKGIVVLPVPNMNPAMAFRRPMVVLVNRASASASEIVAGALQDYGRAVIIGDTQTHGKGSVQTVFSLGAEEMGSVKVTTANFYRITGASTQLKGIASDIVIPSLLDGLDIGEDKLPGALPWTQVDAAQFIRISDLASFIPKLREQSAERLALNPKYTRHCTLVRHVQEFNQRTEVPLEINARRQMMKTEEEIRKLEEREGDDEESPSTARSRKAGEDENVVLDEAINILGDLVILMGNKELPMETEGDLRARLLRIFGGGF